MPIISPSNDGFDCGSFPSAADLPNASGSTYTVAELRTGARAFVPGVGTYTCTDGTPGAAVWTLSGANTGGGTGAQIGPWTKSAVGVGAAFTVLGLAAASTWVATRPGSITGASGFLSAAAADDTIDVAVLINGAPVLYISFQDGGALGASDRAAPGTYPVAQDDLITVAVQGGVSLSNTPDLVAFVEFTAGV